MGDKMEDRYPIVQEIAEANVLGCPFKSNEDYRDKGDE